MFNLYLIFLAIRPFLDLFADFKILGINIASVYTVILLFLSASYFIYGFGKSKRVVIFTCAPILGFIILLISLLPSMISSKNFGNTFSEMLKFLTLIFSGAVFCVYSQQEYERKSFCKAIIFSFVTTGLYSLVQLIFGLGNFDKEVGDYRIYSTFTHPNQYAFYLVAILMLLIVLQKQKFFVRKVNFYILIIFNITLLLFTYSRSAWVWAAFILIGYLLGSDYKHKFWLIIAIAIFACIASDLIINRFADILDGSSKNSMDSRYEIWDNMIGLINSSDKRVLGFGLGTFETYNMLYFNSSLPAHNEYVRFYFEGGLLGLCGLLIYFIIMLIAAFKIRGRSKWIYLFAIIGLMVVSYSSNIFSMLVSQVYFIAIFTLVKPICVRNKFNGTILAGRSECVQ